jgi:SAM-dependent methyltransferase
MQKCEGPSHVLIDGEHHRRITILLLTQEHCGFCEQAKEVGQEGYAIGLDMTPQMVALARASANELGLTNSRFIEGRMEDIPLPDHSVDVVISNGVFNLAPNKDRVFAEAWRVLRANGSLVVADMLLCGDLPAGVRGNPRLLSG